MEGNVGVVDSATQTSDIDSDYEPYLLGDMPNASPRVVIDNSAPFGSVEEAVIRFGGRGYWIPHSMLPVDPATATDNLEGDDMLIHQETEDYDINKLEDRAAAMLKDLQLKEQETQEMLKELELTKRLVEQLKLKLPGEAQECISIPCDGQVATSDRESVKKIAADSIKNQTYKAEDHSNMLPASAAGLIMMELKQAKLNLYQNTNELAAIRASVESLSKKMEKEKNLVEKAGDAQNDDDLLETGLTIQGRNDAERPAGSVNPLVISRELRELNYEADQFMKTAEAARSEVMKAMSDVEQTKTGLKVIEMRWLAAKKFEEAARAAESLALAEIRALSSIESVMLEDYHQQKPRRISLSLEEYSALTDKARKAENLFKRKDLDPFRKIEAAAEEEKFCKMALDDVLGRVEVMNRRKVIAEEALRRFSSQPAQRKPLINAQSDLRNSFPSWPRRDSRLLDSNDFEFVRNGPKPATKQTTSIGEILSQKLVVRDDLEVGRQEESGAGRPRVSLHQMLRRHRGESTPPRRRERDGDEPKHFFSKRKALRFVHISLPLPKHSKNKIQALNLW